MGKFLRNFGLGLVFMICSPVLVCLVAITAVFGLIYFFFMSLKCIFRFLSGRKPFKELEIDHRVKQIKEQLDMSYAIKEKEKTNEAPQEKPVYIQQNYYQAPPNGQIPNQNPYQNYPNPNGQLPNQNPYQNLTNSAPQGYTQIPQGPDIFTLPDVDEVPIKEDDK